MSDYDPYSPPADITGTGDSTRSSGSDGPTETMIEFLRRTRPWTLFISILLFIGAGFMVLFSIGMVIGGIASGGGRAEDIAILVIGGLVYGVMAVVNFFMALQLMRYSRSIGLLVQTGRADDMEDALQAQQKFWKTAGIICIVTMGLTMLAFLVGISVAVAEGL